MRLVVEVNSIATDTPHLTAEAIVHMLEGLVLINRAALRAGEVGALYDTDVVYQDEPPNYESLVDAVTVAERGHGDCAHLSAWRVAELQEQGEDATLTIEWDESVRMPDTLLYHVQVRRGDGSIEDPSAILGMGHEVVGQAAVKQPVWTREALDRFAAVLSGCVSCGG